EVLDSPEPDHDELNIIMAMIQDAISRFKHTLMDLTEVAKLQHQDETAAESARFEELIDDITLNIQDLIFKYDATIDTDFSAAPDMIFSRKNLRSIVYNLVSNAIKYSSPDRKPVIAVNTYREGAFTVFCVKDNGLG